MAEGSGSAGGIRFLFLLGWERGFGSGGLAWDKFERGAKGLEKEGFAIGLESGEWLKNCFDFCLGDSHLAALSEGKKGYHL